MPVEPRITIVLCTRNRAELLAQALDSLAAISFPPEAFELVLVDNASEDSTPSVAEAFRRRAPFSVRVVVEGRRGLSAARNRGIREARGARLFFTDDDQLVDCQVLAEHERAAAKHGGRAQQGGIALRFTHPRPAWLNGELAEVLGETRPLPEGPSRIQLYGGNMFLERALLEELGGFREDLGKGAAGYSEDTELTHRLEERGENIVYAPAALIHHVIGPDRANARFFRRNAFEKGYSHGLIAAPDKSVTMRALRTVRGLSRDGASAARGLLDGDRHRLIEAQVHAAGRLGWWAGVISSRLVG